MTSFTQLTYKERCHLFRLLLKGKPISSIASAIGRHRSTLYCEIERNAGLRDCYQPDRADRKAQGRKQRKSKILRCPHLRSYVDSRLRKGWSPEQIAGRLKHEESFFYACHETIYRYIYSRRGLRKRLHAHLFLAKPRRTARTTRRHRKGKFPLHHANRQTSGGNQSTSRLRPLGSRYTLVPAELPYSQSHHPGRAPDPIRHGPQTGQSPVHSCHDRHKSRHEPSPAPGNRDHYLRSRLGVRSLPHP